MKHDFRENLHRRHTRAGNRKPLRSVTEMAKEFGISTKQLGGYLGTHSDAPKPKIKSLSAPGAKNTWYDPDELRAWWKAHNN